MKLIYRIIILLNKKDKNIYNYLNLKASSFENNNKCSV